jgi:hypothetical protein
MNRRSFPITTMLLAVCLPVVSSAQYVSKPTLGSTGTIQTPIVVNLYWELSHAQWNADVNAAGNAATIERVDALTRALMHTNYFSGLAGDYGVSSASMGPSIVLGDVCPTLAFPPLTTGIGHSLIPSVLQCLSGTLPGPASNLIINVLYPPSVQPAGDLSCPPTSGNAYHDSVNGVALAYIPLNSACNGDLVTAFQSITHEDVEAATDSGTPDKSSGYRAYGNWAGEEIADLCQGGKFGPGALGAMRASPFFQTEFANGNPNGLISNYWSNTFFWCWSGPAPRPFPAKYAPISVCGRGQNMGVSLSFGVGLPWDLGGLQGKRTMYLSATVQSPPGSGSNNSWGAGSPLRVPTGDTIGFSGIQYFPPPPANSDPSVVTAISVYGFDQDVQMAAGDIISFTVTEPSSGLQQTVSAPAPVAAKAVVSVTPPANSPVAGWTLFGDASRIQAQILDSCTFSWPGSPLGGSPGPIEGDLVFGSTASVAETYDPSLPIMPFTAGIANAQGMVQTQLMTDTAGKQVVYIQSPAPGSIAVDVHPVVTSLSPPGGLSTGKQTVVITGAGFAVPLQGPRTTVQVGSAWGTNVVVAPDGRSLSFTTPSVPGGAQPVVVYVDGVPSLPLSFSSCEATPNVCYAYQACNVTISDGCEMVACGACGNGAVCSAGSCCPKGAVGDGTGSCVCKPRLCPKGSSWDGADCICSRSTN